MTARRTVLPRPSMASVSPWKLAQPDAKFSWVWLRHESNSGKGAAIRTGLEYVDTELVVIHDADLEYHPRRSAENGGSISVRGCRRGLRLPFHVRRLQAHAVLPARAGKQAADVSLRSRLRPEPHGHGNLLQDGPRRPAEKHSLESSTFDVEPELAIKLAKRGSRIFEVPISYSGRTYLEGKKIGWRGRSSRPLGDPALRGIRSHLQRRRIRRRNSRTSESRAAVYGLDGGCDPPFYR